MGFRGAALRRVSRGGESPDGRKVKSTIHWVSAKHAIPAEVRLYDHLFNKPNPDEVEDSQDFSVNINPNSLETLTTCRLEPSLANAAAGSRYQFERHGYFIADAKDSSANHLVFNRTVTLRDGTREIRGPARVTICLEPSDRVVVESAGGGGWGIPFQRSIMRLEEDLVRTKIAFLRQAPYLNGRRMGAFDYRRGPSEDNLPALAEKLGLLLGIGAQIRQPLTALMPP